jgi:hypothetical protein
VPQALLSAAIAAPLGWFGVNSSGERFCADCKGQSIVLAVAAYAGNSAADTRLLQQIRNVISNGRDPFGNGGYMAQHERMMTAMFAIAKQTPRVWSQLTSTEVSKIDLIMKATLVGSAYTTADASNQGSNAKGIDGDTNLDRGWNPNFREGMIGGVIVSTLYLGGRTPTEAFLNSYSHATFVQSLNAAGLSRLYEVFNTNVASPSKGAPSGSTIATGIRNYRFNGMNLDQLFEIYVYLANDTFGGTVACGLNNGQGISIGGGQYSGVLVAGCAQLPNKGVRGQLKEFASSDANGQRSASYYAFDGLKPNLANHLVLFVHGRMVAGSELNTVLDRVAVGSADLFYKVTQGYHNYAKGADDGVYKLPASGVGDGYEFWLPLWQQVIAPAYGR